MNETISSCPIAVIGLACRYPGANTPRELWENILTKRRQFRRMPDCRTPLSDYYHSDKKVPDKTYLKNAAVIDGFEFDWKKRRIPFSTYQSTDIVHWLALEVAMAALADAGYLRKSIDGRRTGVIVGNTLTGEHTRANAMRLRWPFVRRALHAAGKTKGIQKETIMQIEVSLEKFYKSVSPPIDEDSLAGGLSNTIAGRICNYLNFGGGGYTVDGACSSSLLAIATAATGLMNKDLDLALVGGVDVNLDPFELIGFAKVSALTANDMRVYDRRADGFLPGEGCGFVLLKRIEDARKNNDFIYAILHGWGISSDGRGASITAPNAEGQARAIRRAYARSPFDIGQIDFIEGHGTGTAVGDQVELEGIARSLDSSSVPVHNLGRYCGITSLKSVIGHTKAAAGVGAFIKAVMAVNQRVLPPTAACRHPHPVFKAKAKALYPILSGKKVASNKSLRAGISAMGFGGINCHVCIESADLPNPKLSPTIKEQTLLASDQETELFILTGRSSNDLLSQVEALNQKAAGISLAEMADLAVDLIQKTEGPEKFRAAIVACNPDQLAERLNRLSTSLKEKPLKARGRYHDAKNLTYVGNGVKTPAIGFIFPGQGAQQLNMAQRLIARYGWARNILKKADQILAHDGHEPIKAIVYHDLDPELGSKRSEDWARTLARTEHAQPAICLASLIWLQWLERIGVRPAAVGGHSLGELTAFHAAGAYDIDTLIRFSGYRGRIFANQARKDGAMISLRCSKKQAEDLLNKVTEYATIANLNTPRQIVISGENTAIKQVARLAADAAIPAFRLAVTGAFHSMLVSNAASAIEKEAILPPELTDLSCHIFNGMDGLEITSGRKLKPYFANQIQAPVNFIALIQSMSNICDLFIEVGPGQTLSGMINEINKNTGPYCLPVESAPGKDTDVNQLLATLFVSGVTINWDTVYESRLTRPFIKPSERLFFENPCERSFDTPVSDEPSIAMHTAENLETLFSGLGDISRENLEQYLNTRGAFIARVIQADMEDGFSGTQWVKQIQTTPPEESIISLDTTKATDPEKSIEPILFDILETITGFSKDTLTPDMRLLDDLNLDSIKTGDLITRVAAAAKIAGEIPPLDFSNMTLDEIVQKLNLFKARKTTALKLEKPDILQAVLDQIANLIGVSTNDINEDAALAKDLKISKAQFKKILPSLSDRIKVDIHVDLDPLIKRTLRQIALILQRLYDEQQPASIGPSETHRPPWTREFHVSMNQQAYSKPSEENKRREDNWKYAHALILSDNPESQTTRAIANKMSKLGARIDVETHLTAHSQHLMERTHYTHFINILPNQPEESPSCNEIEDLREIVTRLASATRIAPASMAPRRRNTVAYLQFGGGFFGGSPETANLNQCGAMALAASIHQERTDLRVRVLDFSSDLSPETIADKTIAEISTPDSFSAAGYDQNLNRRERFQRLMEPGKYQPRSIQWNKEDVIIVTGGAKGITAECALGVARSCGARIALVGRSPLLDSTKAYSEPDEISKTLKKYADQNLAAHYFSCDICDRKAVNVLVNRISKEIGPVTGVIHGAGLNIPKVATQVTIAAAIQEVSPKVLGALNLMAALDQAPPKLFIGLTSLSGVTGMHGNAWYGFSNEALDIVMNRFEADHPETRTLSIAYSIWKDEGMGARMGSVNIFNKQGISAIPTKEGVDRFVRLFFNDPGVHQVIVAARLHRLDTWRFEPRPEIKNYRFLKNAVHVTPGVESAFRVHLSLEKDLYLKDHLFNDSYLFPAVFGLEAMAQVTAHVTGILDFSRVRIENINLSQPISIDPEAGTDILVWAEVELQITDTALTIVKAGIYQPGIGADSDSFSATFILGLNKKPPKYRIRLPKKPLEIHPGPDLYRKNQLFLGPRFQRIKNCWVLETSNDTGKSVVTTLNKRLRDVVADAFLNPINNTMTLGDVFLRDSLLQSAAIIMPQKTSLPIRIDCLDIYSNQIKHPESSGSDLIVSAELQGKKEKEAKFFVIVIDSKGNVIERIEGLRLQILTHHDENPTVSDLLHPDPRDTRMVQMALSNQAQKFSIKTPNACMAYLPNLQNLSRKERHKIELPLLKKTAGQATEIALNYPEEFEITWDKSGQPRFSSNKKIDLNVALSHDDRLCLAISGQGPQGCDIAKITSHSRDEWINFLGKNHERLLDSLTNKGDTLDSAAIRIKASLGLAHKVFGITPKLLDIVRKIDDTVLFGDKKNIGNFLLLSFPLRFTRGRERILTFVVTKKQISDQLDVSHEFDYEYKELLRVPTFGVLKGGPQGQNIFFQRIPVTFKHSSQLSRTIYYSNYFYWAGDIRDIAIWPVLKKVGQEFSTGTRGMVTNKTKLKILNEASVGDRIEIRVWASGSGGSENSTVELTYDFLKMIGTGSYERLAWCEQTVTWVEILDHGVVKPTPYPNYQWELIKKMLPRFEGANESIPMPEPLAGLKNIEGNEVQYRAALAPIIRPKLYTQIFETSLENANLVGNVYFINYYAWQGRLRDQYFNTLIPEYFRGIGEKGELLCLESRVDHLREAMPFDRIIVTMALKIWRTCSAIFHFEYYRINSDGNHVKLAHGDHEAIWVTRNKLGKPIPTPFPQLVSEDFRQKISQPSNGFIDDFQ